MKINITFEKTVRISKDFDTDEKTMEYIKREGCIPVWMWWQMRDYVDEEVDVTETDYAVTDEVGKTIIDWES